jgi:hypothetical protein
LNVALLTPDVSSPRLLKLAASLAELGYGVWVISTAEGAVPKATRERLAALGIASESLDMPIDVFLSQRNFDVVALPDKSA